jgi:hypothetical protein
MSWIAAPLALGIFIWLGAGYGYLRATVAVMMGLAIWVVGLRYLRSVMNAPPEPEITDVSDYGLRYVCSMCGLELRVEKAARDRAPSHCMEPMILEREDGRPPIRPV